MNKLSSFPLDKMGLSEADHDVVIVGVQGWNLTVGDVLDARTQQHSVTEQDERVLFRQAVASKSDGGVLREDSPAGIWAWKMWQAGRAQPRASTAATQPEQASELEMFKEWLAKRDPRTFQPDAYWDHGYKWSAWQARAALAIPASTAASEQQAGAAKPEGYWQGGS